MTGSHVARAAALVLCAGMAACGEENAPPAGWTVRQAESIGSVRGMPVRGPDCRGRGKAEGRGAARRYRRLACVAGARRPVERFDSVAVLYEIRPSGPCCSDYQLARVRFIGGPGIP